LYSAATIDKLAQVFRLQKDHLRRCILPPRLYRGDAVWHYPDAIREYDEAQMTHAFSVEHLRQLLETRTEINVFIKTRTSF